MASQALNLVRTDLPKSNLFNYLPTFEEIAYQGQPIEHVQHFRAVREGQACSLLAVTTIRKDEDFLWAAAKDLLDRSMKQASTTMRGVHLFDLLTFDFHKEMKTFNFAELAQVLANTSFKLQPGEQRLVRYSSVYGLLQKMSEAHWGKIVFKTSVEVFPDKPSFLFTLVSRILKSVEFAHDPVMVLVNDLSTHPLFEPGNEQQKTFLDDLIAKQAKSAIEFPPEVYVQDKTGVRELFSGTVVK